jgi:hypothetical protein
MSAVDKQDVSVVVLERWERERGFGPAPFGHSTWWLAPVRHAGAFVACDYEIPVTASGNKIIEILDITAGIATYRQYVVNPVGVRVTYQVSQIEWRQTMAIGSLRGTLKRMKMVPASTGSTKVEPPVEPCHATAEIIEFPRGRIVRMVRHGEPVAVSP